MQEHAEHSAHDPSLLPVTFTMAVLAVVLAATTLLGHRAHTEELLFQSKATDQWAYYQAKNIREHTYELFLDLLSVSAVKDPAQAEKVRGEVHPGSGTLQGRAEGDRKGSPLARKRGCRRSSAGPIALTSAKSAWMPPL